MFKLLFVCTHNRCRSILCEALARHLAGTRIDAYSAGSQPGGEIHPQTLKHLEQRGIDPSDLRGESWDVYAALSPDAVITVCDRAAGEPCPLWLGQATKVHWGLPDPTQIEGNDEAQAAAFEAVIDTIERRLKRLLGEPFEPHSPDELRALLQRIAEEEPYRGRI